MKTKVCFVTYGCSFNQQDTELMKQFVLQCNSFEIVDEYHDADVIVINGCVVKNPTENKIIHFIKHIQSLNKKVILAGCFGQINFENYKNIVVIGTNTIEYIVDAINATLNNLSMNFISEEKIDKASLISFFNSEKTIQIIPIAEGCLGSCSYCATKFARSSLKSYSIDSIINVIDINLKHGIKEFWLTSQDTGCYGLDINTNIIRLLNKIISRFSDDNFYIRLGMMNPNFALKYIDELIKIFKSDKMFKFIHLPVQSGNNNILSLMRRNYSVDDFLKVVAKFKSNVKSITIVTDIIVGFPGETEIEYQNTFNLIKTLKPGDLNVSRFWPKKNTSAAKLKQLDVKTIALRAKKLHDLFDSIKKENSNQWLNWQGEVYFDELGSKENQYVGRNQFYKTIIVNSNENLLKKCLKVKINNAYKHFLGGVLL